MAATQEERTALALAALGEVTDPNDVGELIAVETTEEGVVDLRFACRLAAYPGWYWTVSTSDLDDDVTTVLEVELLPGAGALLAPPWVPWTERLADWRRLHPDEPHPDEPADDADLDEEAELDEDDLAVDDELDELDELDETELEGVEDPEADASDEDEDEDSDADPDEDWDEDVRGPRPAEVDRSL